MNTTDPSPSPSSSSRPASGSPPCRRRNSSIKPASRQQRQRRRAKERIMLSCCHHRPPHLSDCPLDLVHQLPWRTFRSTTGETAPTPDCQIQGPQYNGAECCLVRPIFHTGVWGGSMRFQKQWQLQHGAGWRCVCSSPLLPPPEWRRRKVAALPAMAHRRISPNPRLSCRWCRTRAYRSAGRGAWTRATTAGRNAQPATAHARATRAIPATRATPASAACRDRSLARSLRRSLTRTANQR